MTPGGEVLPSPPGGVDVLKVVNIYFHFHPNCPVYMGAAAFFVVILNEEARMASAAHDYQHFVRCLHVPETGASEGARRIANLVLNNFDAVGATTRNRSQRAIHIAELARDQFARTNSVLPLTDAIAAGAEWRSRNLTELLVGRAI